MSSSGDVNAAASRSTKLRLAAALLAWPLGVLALRGLATVPDFVERWYSNGLFVGVRAVQRTISGLLPVSLSELLLAGCALWLGALSVRSWQRWRRCEVRLSGLARVFACRSVYAAGGLWVAFLMLWGFQHARRPYAWHVQLEPQPVAVAELKQLSAWLVDECNHWRAELAPGELTMVPASGGVDARILDAYEGLGSRVPALRGGAPLLRYPLISPLMSRVGISGIYSPFTGEAHLNEQVQPWVKPFSACHELAHQKGFAREDEANFIAWQVCKSSQEPALNYSASLVALSFALRALRKVHALEAEMLIAELDEAVLDDLDANRRFWKSKHSVVTDVSIKVNDTYLKSAGSDAGVRSYGRMLDLLVAERRSAEQ